MVVGCGRRREEEEEEEGECDRGRCTMALRIVLSIASVDSEGPWLVVNVLSTVAPPVRRTDVCGVWCGWWV